MKANFDQEPGKQEEVTKELYGDAVKRWENAHPLPRKFNLKLWEEKYNITKETWLEHMSSLENEIINQAPEESSFSSLDITTSEGYSMLVILLEQENRLATEFEKLHFFFIELVLDLQPSLLSPDEKKEWLTAYKSTGNNFNTKYTLPILSKITSLSDDAFSFLLSTLQKDGHSNFYHELLYLRRENRKTEASHEAYDYEIQNSVLSRRYQAILKDQLIFVIKTVNGKDVPIKPSHLYSTICSCPPEEQEKIYSEMMEQRVPGALEELTHLLQERVITNTAIARLYQPDSKNPVTDEYLKEFGGEKFFSRLRDLYRLPETQAVFDAFHTLRNSFNHQEDLQTPYHYTSLTNPYPEISLPYEGAVELIKNAITQLFPGNEDIPKFIEEIVTTKTTAHSDVSLNKVSGNSRFYQLWVSYLDNNTTPTLTNEGVSFAHEMGHALHTDISHTLGGNVMFLGNPYTAEPVAILNELLLMRHILDTITFETKEQELSVRYTEILKLYGKLFINFIELESEYALYNQPADVALTSDMLDTHHKEIKSKWYKDYYTLHSGVEHEWVLNNALFGVRPFYRTSYIIAVVAALTFLQKIEKDPKETGSPWYLDYLKEHTYTPPQELLARYGVDIENNLEELFVQALHYLQEKITELTQESTQLRG